MGEYIRIKLSTYLKIPTESIFYPEADNPNKNLQELLAVLYDCSDSDIKLLQLRKILIEIIIVRFLKCS